jgi:ribosomal protein L7/L12
LNEIELKDSLQIKDSTVAILGMTLYKHASVHKMDKVDTFILMNQIIQAIKEYRNQFGTSLIESKERVNERKAYLQNLGKEGIGVSYTK